MCEYSLLYDHLEVEWRHQEQCGTWNALERVGACCTAFPTHKDLVDVCLLGHVNEAVGDCEVTSEKLGRCTEVFELKSCAEALLNVSDGRVCWGDDQVIIDVYEN